MDSRGQGLPESNSSASASGDLVLHSVRRPALFVQRVGSLPGTKLGT